MAVVLFVLLVGVTIVQHVVLSGGGSPMTSLNRVIPGAVIYSGLAIGA